MWVAAATLFAAMNTTDADAGPASRGWVVVSLPGAAAAPLPPLPVPPPAVNNTAIRLCLGALPRGDDAEAVGTCIRGGAAGARPPPPPPLQQQGCEGSSEAPSGSAAPWVLSLILAMAVAYLAIALRKEQRANRAALGGSGGRANGGGGGGSRAVELQGVALLP